MSKLHIKDQNTSTKHSYSLTFRKKISLYRLKWHDTYINIQNSLKFINLRLNYWYLDELFTSRNVFRETSYQCQKNHALKWHFFSNYFYFLALKSQPLMFYNYYYIAFVTILLKSICNEYTKIKYCQYNLIVFHLVKNNIEIIIVESSLNCKR